MRKGEKHTCRMWGEDGKGERQRGEGEEVGEGGGGEEWGDGERGRM